MFKQINNEIVFQKRMSSLQKMNKGSEVTNSRNTINYYKSNILTKPPKYPSPLKYNHERRSQFLKDKYKEIRNKVIPSIHRKTLTVSVFLCDKISKLIPNKKTQRSCRKSMSQNNRKVTTRYTIDEDINTDGIEQAPEKRITTNKNERSVNDTNMRLSKKMKIDFDSFQQYIHLMERNDGTCDQILFDDNYVKQIEKVRMKSNFIFDTSKSCS